MRRRVLLGAAISLLGLASPAAATTLYDDLGGEAGVTHIVDVMYQIVLADPRIMAIFDNINTDHIKSRLVQQFCQVADGPCHYTGVSMKGAHRGLDLTDADFNALVEDLETAMDRTGITTWTQNRLLARLAPMRRDIVTR